MLTALRCEVQSALAETSSSRKPALRRSDAPDALLATDLPLIADADAQQAFIRRLEGMGWRVLARSGWFLLDKPVPAPQCAISPHAAGECACCISLLARHPDGGDAASAIRAVVKAAESGAQPFERLCAQLHRHLAAALRRHEPLPGALLPYLCQACYHLYERREQL
ncbi:MAG: hypothetical protein IJ438_07755 [Clostridia bacterium]|nr:hypothetical protein [Clostridia bacterium]